MSRKIIVCESCDAEFKIQHDMEEHFYSVKYCPFCASSIDLEDDFEDEDEWEG